MTVSMDKLEASIDSSVIGKDATMAERETPADTIDSSSVHIETFVPVSQYGPRRLVVQKRIIEQMPRKPTSSRPRAAQAKAQAEVIIRAEDANLIIHMYKHRVSPPNSQHPSTTNQFGE